jgi:hypothetical protein
LGHGDATLPELRAAFSFVGPGVPAGRSLGLVDVRDIKPTVARRLGLALPAAEGKAQLALMASEKR